MFERIPTPFRETARVWLFGLFKVPMLFWLRPRVLRLDSESCEVMIPLSRRSQNHLKSMYFGALSAGADCAGGLMAMALIQQSGHHIDLSFKDFHAEFIKRATADTHFVCQDGALIRDFVDKVIASGERENLSVRVVATCPSINSAEEVARFTLTLSLKLRAKA
jgi:acyl-coenzyme A thioesterase PaaI-like protein